MKVICEGLDLSDAVLKVIKAAAVKPVNPILEGNLSALCTYQLSPRVNIRKGEWQ